jgi:glyoxylase-like metal-dependent hydrolase (beta-lactamase superfamily II)
LSVLIQGFVVGQLQANCYAVGDEQTREVMIIDPGDNAPELLERFREEELRVSVVIATHSHLDHTGGLHELLEGLPEAAFYMHRADYAAIGQQAPSAPAWYGRPVTPPREPDRYIDHGDTIEVGSESFTVLHCPGHTAGHVCIAGGGVVFTGDVLFQGSIGRSDFPGSDGPTLLASIRDHLLTLPDETVVYSGP